MKYYVCADPHGFYTHLVEALQEKGFFKDEGDKKLIICGDVMDRGDEAQKMQEFICDLIDKDQVILIRGNHEDLLMDFIREVSINQSLLGVGGHHYSNGTVNTCLQLTNMTKEEANCQIDEFVNRLTNTLYYTKIIPSMIDYFELDEYIFVHGWIPCTESEIYYGIEEYQYKKNWRNATRNDWKKARWINGICAHFEGVKEEGKTIVCGHWHTSYGHARIERICSEWGDDADFSPYMDDGIIALDACTAYSHEVNCIVIEK